MNDKCNTNNNGFFDGPAEERAAVMEHFAEQGGVDNFFDLPPEERAQAYDSGYEY